MYVLTAVRIGSACTSTTCLGSGSQCRAQVQGFLRTARISSVFMPKPLPGSRGLSMDSAMLSSRSACNSRERYGAKPV